MVASASSITRFPAPPLLSIRLMPFCEALSEAVMFKPPAERRSSTSCTLLALLKSTVADWPRRLVSLIEPSVNPLPPRNADKETLLSEERTSDPVRVLPAGAFSSPRSAAALESPIAARLRVPPPPLISVRVIWLSPGLIDALTLPARAVLIASSTPPMVLTPAKVMSLAVPSADWMVKSAPVEAVRTPRASFSCARAVFRPR